MLLRESRNEIHHDLLEREGAFLSGDAVERYPLFVGYDFVLLTGCAAFNVVCNPLSHPHPWQDFRSFPNCFISSGMPCGRVVMDEGHEVSFRGVWDLHCDSINKEFRLEEGLILVIVVSLI